MALIEGVDLLSLPPHRALNVIYLLFTRRLDEAEKDKFDRRMDLPLPGETPEDGVWSKQKMGSDFLAAMNAAKDPLAEYDLDDVE